MLWKRGKRAIDTKKKELGPTLPKAKFNDKFEMKTNMDYDQTIQKFTKKSSILGLYHSKDLSIAIGETDFDLAKYANMNKAIVDRLPLQNCKYDSNSYIEISISANILEETQQKAPSPRNAQPPRTPKGK